MGRQFCIYRVASLHYEHHRWQSLGNGRVRSEHMSTRLESISSLYSRCHLPIRLGMCHEKLHPEDQELAIQAYATAIPLLNVIEFEIPRTLTAPASPSSFSLFRELWRWVERLMFRAITLLARTRHLDDQEGLIWNLFTRYESCSTHWPPTFRTSHRSIIAVLHLRALIIRFRAPSQATPSPSLQPEKPPQWLNTARSIINQYRTILDKCTHFPKAGERNVKVEDLVDISVAVWEASGAIAGRAQWVIDVSEPSIRPRPFSNS